MADTFKTDPSVRSLQDNAIKSAALRAVVTIAAAGATQGNATQVPENVGYVAVTVTASSQGIKLPTAATNKRVVVLAASAKGVKVYPFTGDRIQGAATNVAVALVLNKSSEYIAVDANNWRVLKGA